MKSYSVRLPINKKKKKEKIEEKQLSRRWNRSTFFFSIFSCLTTKNVNNCSTILLFFENFSLYDLKLYY